MNEKKFFFLRIPASIYSHLFNIFRRGRRKKKMFPWREENFFFSFTEKENQNQRREKKRQKVSPFLPWKAGKMKFSRQTPENFLLFFCLPNLIHNSMGNVHHTFLLGNYFGYISLKTRASDRRVPPNRAIFFLQNSTAGDDRWAETAIRTTHAYPGNKGLIYHKQEKFLRWRFPSPLACWILECRRSEQRFLRERNCHPLGGGGGGWKAALFLPKITGKN